MFSLFIFKRLPFDVWSLVTSLKHHLLPRSCFATAGNFSPCRAASTMLMRTCRARMTSCSKSDGLVTTSSKQHVNSLKELRNVIYTNLLATRNQYQTMKNWTRYVCFAAEILFWPQYIVFSGHNCTATGYWFSMNFLCYELWCIDMRHELWCYRIICLGCAMK